MLSIFARGQGCPLFIYLYVYMCYMYVIIKNKFI